MFSDRVIFLKYSTDNSFSKVKNDLLNEYDRLI